MSAIEMYGMNREQVARVCCISEAQVKGWAQDRGRLFPEKERGRGTPWSYRMTDAMKLSCVAALVDSGMNIGQACDAIRPYSPYGSFLHDGPDFVLSLNEKGRWVGAWGTNTPVRLVINLLPLFKRVVAGVEEIVSEDDDLTAEDKESLMTEWRNLSEKLISTREQQSQTQVRGNASVDATLVSE